MGNIAIVAIPTAQDVVWKFSSEKIPHMTLLFLGDGPLQNEENIIQYVQHVTSTSLHKFGMSVDRRDVLGPNKADVLIFDKGWANADIEAARGYLLADPNINEAYLSADQYEGWIPHLTLGFPETPIKKEPENSYELNYVQFDRIAIWTDDYAGPEFRLGSEDMSLEPMYHSDMALKTLQHSGTKGMKWGIRRRVGSDGLVKGPSSNNPNAHSSEALKKISADHERVVTALAKKNSDGVNSLSDRELKDVANRAKALNEFHKAMTPEQKSSLQKQVDQLRLEKDFNTLTREKKDSQKGFIRKLAEKALANSIDNVAKDPIGSAERAQQLIEKIMANQAARKASRPRSRQVIKIVKNSGQNFGKNTSKKPKNPKVYNITSIGR